MKKSIRLYNMILPIWLLWVFPPFIFICIILNTLIDFLVTFIAMKKLKIEDRKNKIKKSIVKIVFFGFLADFIGVIILLILTYFIDHNSIEFMVMNPFKDILSLILFVLVIAIVGFFIYLFNYKINFKKIDISDYEKKIISISLAIFTAPYTFLIPTEWFMHLMN